MGTSSQTQSICQVYLLQICPILIVKELISIITAL